MLIPALKDKRPQLSSEESNHPRFVRKIRWIVHGVIEQLKLLDHKIYTISYSQKWVPIVKYFWKTITL